MFERFWSISLKGVFYFRTEVRTDMSVKESIDFTNELRNRFPKHQGFAVVHFWRESLPYHMIED